MTMCRTGAYAAPRGSPARRGRSSPGRSSAVADRGAQAVRAFGERGGTVVSRCAFLEPSVVARAFRSRSRPAARRSERATRGGSTPSRTTTARRRPRRRNAAFPTGAAADHARGRRGPRRALATRRPLTPADLRAGARAQNAAGLERLARRVQPSSAGTISCCRRRSRSPAARAGRTRARIATACSTTGGWARTSSKGRGITALFAGDSRHRQDDGGRGRRPRARPRPVRDRPLDGRRQVHRRDREEPRPDLRRSRPASTGCCSSTRPTRCSASAPRSRTRTTATPTSRSRTCCSAWSSSTASRS